MSNKLTYTIEFTAPDQALAADCIHLIRALKQEAQDKLPVDWAVKMSLALGVQEGARAQVDAAPGVCNLKGDS